MTTYDTPHFATGNSDLRSEPPRPRPASAAPYRTAGVTNEAAAMREVGQRPDWQPGASKGVPKAAIGAVGAALVGGVALAIVLMAPSNKVVKHVQPDPIAQARSENNAAQKSVASTDAAVNELDKNAPAAGNSASQAALAAQQASAVAAQAAVPAPVQNVVPDAPPVANAPVAHVPKHVSTPRVAPQHAAPAAAKTDTSADSPAVTPPADVQAPAMQQTPDTPTVAPTAPPTAPTTPPDTPAQAPAQ
ncbi:MAG TPA: hypothetical protein VIN75_12950 [Burkholderiaceae bacterium]